MNLNKPTVAVFMAYYSIGKSSPVLCLLEFLSINYIIDLHLFNGRHLDSPIIEKINNIFQYENKYKDTNLVQENKTSKYHVYISLDANGFVLCKTLFPNSKPFYYSLELYFRDNFFNLHYPKEIMDIEHREINNISGLIIQSEEREKYFREEYNLNSNTPTFHLPVTYNEKSNRTKSDYLRKKFNVDNNKKILLHLGGIVDFHCLVEITESFKNINDWVLVIHGAGNENYKNSLKVVIQKYQINNVIISGEYFEDIDELDKILQSADAGIVWYKDVSPNFSTAGKSSGKISAYLRFGLPVVANFYKSTKEAIEVTNCGYCVYNFDDIQLALRKIQNKYDYLRRNCLELYDKFYWFGNYTDSLNVFIDRNIKGIKLQNTNSDMFLNIKLNYDNIDKYYIRTSIKRAIDNNLHQFKGIFLDLGCGEMPYKDYIQSNSKISKYVGLDIENPTYQKNIKPDIFWDGKIIPFDDKSVDTLMATEVFEHLPNIDDVLKEIFRVLKPGGILFFTVPFLWPLHDVPYDEYRYTPFALERHFKNAGFESINIAPYGGWNASLAQMIGLWLKRSGLNEQDRLRLSEQFFPFYQQLLESDITPKKYDKGPMVPGFSGTVKKQELLQSNQKNSMPLLKNESQTSDKMKVIIIVYYFPKLSETFILDQIVGLEKRGVNYEIWAQAAPNEIIKSPDLDKYKILDKCRYLKFPKNSLAKSEWTNQFLKLNNIRIDNSTLFHIHFGQNFIKFEKLFQEISNSIIVSFHGLDASQYIKENGNKCYDYLFNRAAKITTPSYEMKNVLTNIGCSNNKVIIHRYGVDTLKFSPKSGIRSTNNQFTFLTVARLVEKKGIEDSLKAFSMLNHPNIIYNIIGDGPLEIELKSHVNQLGISHKVNFLGSKTNVEVLEYMLKSDVYVLTSITASNGDKEGLPVTLIEAQAVGMPVISTYHAGIPELVTNNETGFLCIEKDYISIAEKMNQLVTDTTLLNIFKSNARKKVIEEFDINVLNENLYNLYKEIIDIKPFAYKNEEPIVEKDNLYCPICKGWLNEFLPVVVQSRANSKCPKCGSLETDRLLWLLIEKLIPNYRNPINLLHLSADLVFEKQLRRIQLINYSLVDLNQENVNVKMNFKDLKFNENSFNCIICINALNHFHNVIKTISEIYKVLKPGGWVLLNTQTYPFINNLDFVNTIKLGGFRKVQILTYKDFLSDQDIKLMNISSSEAIYLCVKD